MRSVLSQFWNIRTFKPEKWLVISINSCDGCGMLANEFVLLYSAIAEKLCSGHENCFLKSIQICYNKKSRLVSGHPPHVFIGILIKENLFKNTFHVVKCIKTCQREQVNNFPNIWYMQNALWIIFELKFHEGGGKLEKSQSSDHVHYRNLNSYEVVKFLEEKF